jgi:putative spermidine/putrescine transport system permease protein
VFAALARDLKKAQEERTAALLGKRLNYELPGIRSRLVSTARRLAEIESGPWKEALIGLDEVWAESATWAVIARNGGRTTPYYR